MKTNSTRTGRLLVPIVTVLYVILSVLEFSFFFGIGSIHSIFTPRCTMFRLLDRSDNLNFNDDNAEYGVLRRSSTI